MESGVTRVTVNLPVRVWEALEELAAIDGLSRTEALRRAISTEVFLRAAIRDGAEVLLRRPGSPAALLLFPDALPNSVRPRRVGKRVKPGRVRRSSQGMADVEADGDSTVRGRVAEV